MGGICSTYGGEERSVQGFGGKTMRERDHLEDPGIDWRIILKLIFKKWEVGIEWIDRTQDRDRWRAVVNVVMNLRVP